jgi:ABC-type nitrate/sulfonate/bicarbonate transport system substrate-binding protein
VSAGRLSKRIPTSAAPSALGPSVIRASWLALALTATPVAADAADKLVLQLHRAAQFEFAGYYAALWQGFYREAGLEVEIDPGSPPGASPIDPVREIVEGRAQFGTGTVQLLIRTAEGQALLLLAPIFQQSDARVYYRATSLPLERSLMAGLDGCPRATFSMSSCVPRSMPKRSIRTS